MCWIFYLSVAEEPWKRKEELQGNILPYIQVCVVPVNSQEQKFSSVLLHFGVPRVWELAAAAKHDRERGKK